jgi:hypothetical protein
MSLEEVLNPFLDRKGAMFGAAIMAATLITVLAINAASQGSHERPVFWVTLPAAFVMLIFDLTMGWLGRAETRKIAHEGRRRAETALAERAETRRKSVTQEDLNAITPQIAQETIRNSDEKPQSFPEASSHILSGRTREMTGIELVSQEEKKLGPSEKPMPTTLASIVADSYRWAQETFPTTMTVFHHLPLALVPFAFCMFVLVQALVTKGWVPVFAHAWDHWVEKTGTVGAIGGMGFVSVILCNVRPRNHHYETTANIMIVRWYQHRHHNPHFQSNPGVGRNPPSKRQSDFRSNLLGHDIQHGHWRQLWCFQSGLQRIAGWHAVA